MALSRMRVFPMRESGGVFLVRQEIKIKSHAPQARAEALQEIWERERGREKKRRDFYSA